MKRIFSILMLFALTAATSCSDNEDDPTVIIPGSFGGDLTDCKDKAVKYETFDTVVSGADCTFNDIFTGMKYAAQDEFFMNTFNGMLFSYEDKTTTVSISSYYTDYGGSYDTFAGFILSKNYTTSATGSYAQQFDVYASFAADSAEAFLSAYDGTMMVGYGPKISLSEGRVLESICFANSPMVISYANTTKLSVEVVGYAGDTMVGTKEVEMIDEDGNASFSNWSKVEFDWTEAVDELTFTVKSTDAMAPAYFCIDAVTFK